jgi:hypothetical protein
MDDLFSLNGFTDDKTDITEPGDEATLLPVEVGLLLTLLGDDGLAGDTLTTGIFLGEALSEANNFVNAFCIVHMINKYTLCL